MLRMGGKRRAVVVLSLCGAVGALLLALWLHRPPIRYSVTILPRVGMQVVVPCSINDRGQIVGVCGGRFYLWERGKDWRELGQASEGLDINNAGQIAGTVDDPSGGAQAFLWDPNEGMTMLGTFGTGMSSARALNNRGQIVGRCWNKARQGGVFVWSKMEGVRFMGGSDSGPTTLNDVGQVIGYRGASQPPQPVLWEPTNGGSMVEMSPPAGALYNINNNGYVLGKAFNPNKGETLRSSGGRIAVSSGSFPWRARRPA